MAKPCNPIPAMIDSPVVVIGQKYLRKFQVDLIIPSKKLSSTGDFNDVNGDVIFKIKSKTINVPRRHFLIDPDGNTLVTLRQKTRTAHKRWEGFRGKSTEEEDLLFSVRKSSLFSERTELDVFLADNNTSGKLPDFKIRGDGIGGSCVIFLGDRDYCTESVIGLVKKLHTENLVVTTYPNVDYAFVSALAVVLDKINVDSGVVGLITRNKTTVGLALDISVNLATAFFL